MSLASDSSVYADRWPFLFLGIALVFGALVYYKIKNGRWK